MPNLIADLENIMNQALRTFDDRSAKCCSKPNVRARGHAPGSTEPWAFAETVSNYTSTPMSTAPTTEGDKYDPSGILLTSGLLHSFIQGIIISQVARYYECYYHLDTFSMKLYVASIVVVSL